MYKAHRYEPELGATTAELVQVISTNILKQTVTAQPIDAAKQPPGTTVGERKSDPPHTHPIRAHGSSAISVIRRDDGSIVDFYNMHQTWSGYSRARPRSDTLCWPLFLFL